MPTSHNQRIKAARRRRKRATPTVRDFEDVGAKTARAAMESIVQQRVKPKDISESFRRRKRPRHGRIRRRRRQIGLPKELDFPNKSPEIGDITNTSFETVRDWDGWFFENGPHRAGKKLGKIKRAPFPGLRELEAGTKEFIYPMAESGGPTRIALFADFGTGLYHSRYIARHVAVEQPEYAIHLGDVYYVGDEREFRRRLEGPIKPVIDAGVRFFEMNGNHEMDSGGFGYFDYLRRKRRLENQEQEASFFCIRGKRYQVVAVDTSYWDETSGGGGTFPAKSEPLYEWLVARLKEGRRKGLVTIFVTPEHPYDLTTGTGLQKLVKRLPPEVNNGFVAIWFWGHVHYAALYGATRRTPFIGSCIGHGGYQYALSELPRRSKTRESALWVEREPRFPTWIRSSTARRRHYLGNAGYCVLALYDDRLEISYLDWMKTERLKVDARIVKYGNRLALVLPPLHVVTGQARLRDRMRNLDAGRPRSA